MQEVSRLSIYVQWSLADESVQEPPAFQELLLPQLRTSLHLKTPTPGQQAGLDHMYRLGIPCSSRQRGSGSFLICSCSQGSAYLRQCFQPRLD